MLYHLFKYLSAFYDIPGARLFDYISFRAGVGAMIALLIGIIFGKKIINILHRKTKGEQIRDLGLNGQLQKAGTPTMGGLIILVSILVPVLLLSNLTNMYTWLMITTLVWLSALGFIDDYIKVIKRNKKGLRGGLKIAGQAGIGIIIGLTLYFHNDFVVREKAKHVVEKVEIVVPNALSPKVSTKANANTKSTITTIPFVKDNEFDYKRLVPKFINGKTEAASWVVFIIVCIIIIIAVSNGANLTDGMDGLAAGVSLCIGVALGILAYLSNNIIYAEYLSIMYIPNSGEMVVFMAALAGALIGFLWYNTYPSQIFMGDTGSLALGGILAVCAIIIRKELLIPILCGIFFAESCSVVIQVVWFKFTRRRYGVGRRVFLMAPLHHHYQKKGVHETKIVVRFCIVAALLAIITVLTLKVR
jgi:phospho-N-acetylmuramoyl-pentapeptide-transferase